MENKVFLEQKADALRGCGFVSCGNPEFALEIMAALPKPEFEEVKHIFGIGPDCVDGYLYLPRGRRIIGAIIRRHLRESKAAIVSNTRALKTITGV